MKRIKIKTIQPYFDDVKSGKKKFELRNNDKDYTVDDVVEIAEWDGNNFTGDLVEITIKYVLKDCPQYGLAEGYCIFCW